MKRTNERIPPMVRQWQSLLGMPDMSHVVQVPAEPHICCGCERRAA